MGRLAVSIGGLPSNSRNMIYRTHYGKRYKNKHSKILPPKYAVPNWDFRKNISKYHIRTCTVYAWTVTRINSYD